MDNFIKFGIETGDEEEFTPEDTTIKVIGVGGGGGNALNHMIRSGMEGVEFIAMNTDAQALNHSLAEKRIILGNGLGAGGNPVVGQRAAEESRETIAAALRGAHMVFIAAGMGGGTGTGAAPVIAEVARKMDILTVAVVTKPFWHENRVRIKNAEIGVASLRENVDALIVIPNDRLSKLSGERLTAKNAFAMADSVLSEGVRNIYELIFTTGEINLDFADVTAIMKDSGTAFVNVGTGKCDDSKAKALIENGRYERDKKLSAIKSLEMANEAFESAINCVLVEVGMEGAKGLLVNFVCNSAVTTTAIKEVAGKLKEKVDKNVNFVWGLTYDDDLKDEMKIIVVATGLDSTSVQDCLNNITNYRPKSGGNAQDIAQAATAAKQMVDAAHSETAAASAALAQAAANISSDDTVVGLQRDQELDNELDDQYNSILDMFQNKRKRNP